MNLKLFKRKLDLEIKKLKDLDITDLMLVEEVYYNLELMQLAKDDIELRGIVTNISKDGEVLQKNHSIAVYNDSLRNIMNIARRLGLTVRDKKELKIKQNLEDGFDFD